MYNETTDCVFLRNIKAQVTSEIMLLTTDFI